LRLTARGRLVPLGVATGSRGRLEGLVRRGNPCPNALKADPVILEAGTRLETRTKERGSHARRRGVTALEPKVS